MLFFIEWMRGCFANNYIELTVISEKFAGLSKSAQKSFLLYALEILRESLVAGQGEQELVRMSGNELDFVEKFSQTLNTVIIEHLSERLSDAHYHLERNANAKIVFMNLSIVFSNSFKR